MKRAAVEAYLNGGLWTLVAEYVETESGDELEERHLFKLFPDEELGVAQGSALSALAGNIALRDFDAAMNGRGIVCVRYIDDFILLGKSERNVLACYASAQKILRQMGMEAYELRDAGARKSGKVDAGNIYNGTEVLGYTISGTSLQPCAAACQNLLGKLDQVVLEAEKEMRAVAAGDTATHLKRYHRAHVLMDDIIWGWSQAFRHTTAKHVFESLDAEIDRRLAVLAATTRALTGSASPAMRRRIIGVHLLVDTEQLPLSGVAA